MYLDVQDSGSLIQNKTRLLHTSLYPKLCSSRLLSIGDFCSDASTVIGLLGMEFHLYYLSCQTRGFSGLYTGKAILMASSSIQRVQYLENTACFHS
jgi:hypothetical protein